MLSLSQDHAIRCIALDRRGFGRSDWNSAGGKDEITYETFAIDTVHVLKETLKEEEKFVFVGASMGCGEGLMAWDGKEHEWIREKCAVCVYHPSIFEPTSSLLEWRPLGEVAVVSFSTN